MSTTHSRAGVARLTAYSIVFALLGLMAACAPQPQDTGANARAGISADGCAEPLPGTPEFAAMVAARQHVFGAENVNAANGKVRRGQAILSWFGISSYAAALNGHVVLLDAFVQNRTERPGYVPTSVDELIALRPEALFIGHGHGDHGELASRIAGGTCAALITTPENCAQFSAGAKDIYGAETQLNCITVTDEGSGPGEQIVEVDAFAPDMCITAFRHVHSDTVPPDPDRIPNPPLFFPDPSSVLLHPPGPPPYDTAAGTSGDEGGSLFFQFRMRDFSLVWMDTVGPAKEQAPELFDVLRGLPSTDVMVGAILGFNIFTNGFRDAAMYAEAVRPQIFVPNHHDFIAPDGAQDDWQATFQRDLDALPEDARPELRWMVNPYDYLRPGLLTFSLDDPRWSQDTPGRRDGWCG